MWLTSMSVTSTWKMLTLMQLVEAHQLYSIYTVRSTLGGASNCGSCSVNHVNGTSMSYHVTLRPHFKWVRKKRRCSG